jgi:hypothetical protein
MNIGFGAFSSFTTLKVKVPSGLAIFPLRYLKQLLVEFPHLPSFSFYDSHARNIPTVPNT